MPDTPIDMPAATNVSAPVANTYAVPTVTSGVAMNPPPTALATSIADSIKAACAVIEPGHSTALVARVDTKGANVIVARKFESGWAADAYFGRTWVGDTNAGFEVMKSW